MTCFRNKDDVFLFSLLHHVYFLICQLTLSSSFIVFLYSSSFGGETPLRLEEKEGTGFFLLASMDFL